MAIPKTRQGTRGHVVRNPSEAISAAKRTGFLIGRQVRIGVVTGVVVGYNIARCGQFEGWRYPLLVQTGFGIAKCATNELALT